jgi:hypothetical protein
MTNDEEKKFYNFDDKVDDGSPSPNSRGEDKDGLWTSMTSQNVIKNNATGNVKLTRFSNQSVNAYVKFLLSYEWAQ